MSNRGIFSTVYDPSLGQSVGTPYIIGRVTRVVMGPYKLSEKGKSLEPLYKGPSDIGKVAFEILYSTLINVDSATEGAYPIFDFIKQIPLENEIVFIVPGPTEALNDRTTKTQFFYFPPYSVWNRVNHGAFPNIQKSTEFANRDANEPGYQGTSAQTPEIPLGTYYKEKETVRNLRPFEGDTIIQGRNGQSIRLGSTTISNTNSDRIKNSWSKTGKNGDPITIIMNDQSERSDPSYVDMVEDINRDGSSIFMTSTQTIFLEDVAAGVFPLKSFGSVDIEKTPLPPVEIRYLPTSNEVLSAEEQDKKALS